MVLKKKQQREMVICYPPDDVPMMEDPERPGHMIPDDTWLIVNDGEPVDGEYWEKQMHLLTQPLHLSWKGPDGDGDFRVFSNVGLFFSATEPPIVPDVMLTVRKFAGRRFTRKNLRSYFVWRIGKVPDVAIEIVSNRIGGEDTRKLVQYARIGVPWYVIFDPELEISGEILRIYRLRRGRYRQVDETFFPEVQLGVTLWDGEFESCEYQTWLRWCDANGVLIPTGIEAVEAENKRTRKARQRAQQEKQRAEHEKQRAELEEQRAEQEKLRAEQEKLRADREKQRADRLAALLRQHGIAPPNGKNGQ